MYGIYISAIPLDGNQIPDAALCKALESRWKYKTPSAMEEGVASDELWRSVIFVLIQEVIDEELQRVDGCTQP